MGPFVAPEAAELVRPVRKLMRVAWRVLSRDPERVDEVREVVLRATRESEAISRARRR